MFFSFYSQVLEPVSKAGIFHRLIELVLARLQIPNMRLVLRRMLRKQNSLLTPYARSPDKTRNQSRFYLWRLIQQENLLCRPKPQILLRSCFSLLFSSFRSLKGLMEVCSS